MTATSIARDCRGLWQEACSAFVSSAHLHGLSTTDLTITGTPLRLAIGGWCSVVLVEGPRDPVVIVRSMAPGNGTFSVELLDDPLAVASDLGDAITALRFRRNRVLDRYRMLVEAELRDMVELSGWHCDGVGGRVQSAASFRDTADRIRGKVVRSDTADGDPARARFSIVADISGLTYAQAMAALGALHHVDGR